MPGMDTRMELRTEFSELFLYADDCFDTARKVMSLESKGTNKEAVSGIMFARCLSEYQGAILLAEHGLPIESMTLSRALYETAFVLGGLANDTVTPEDLADHDFFIRRKMGNAVLNFAKNSSPEEIVSKLTTFIEEHTDASEVKFYNLAREAGMVNAYDGIYRHLSHFAAHPSITAASDYYVDEGNGLGRVVLIRLTKYTPKAILFASQGLMLACGCIEHISGTNAETNKEIKQRLDREEELHEKYNPLDVNAAK